MKAIFGVICLAVIIVTTARAQPARPSPPKPSVNNKTLGANLKLMQDKINAQGEIRYTMISETTVQGGTVEDQ